MRDFRKYEVWHLAISVTRKIYSKTRDLPIAIGSSFEVENLPELIYKLRYIKTEKLQEVLTELNLLQRKLNNCIQILSGRFYSILFLNAYLSQGRSAKCQTHRVMFPIGCWLLASSCWLLAFGYRVLATGIWLLAIGKWLDWRKSPVAN